jgi:predicted PhzF superfamily epimerase YddE/YHI9
MFAPWIGIDEDPVTGAAHAVLGPYWSSILGKARLSARQASSRGGEMVVAVDASAGRVSLTGSACIVMRGELHI